MQWVLSFHSLFISNSLCFISPFRFQSRRPSVRLVRLCSPYGWKQSTSTAHFTLNLVPCSSVPLSPNCAKRQLTSTHVTPAFRTHCLPLHRFRPPWIFLLPPSSALLCLHCPPPFFFCVAANSINRLAFVMESQCVYFEVWTAGAFAIGLESGSGTGLASEYFGLPLSVSFH